MSTPMLITTIVLGVLAAVLVVLFILGKRAEKKQAAQQEQIDAMKQTVSMLIIDKKKMRLKDANLPQAVLDQTPKLMRMAKLPIVKAKVGPQILSLVCDEKIYDLVPVKKEVKATISGIYITEVRGLFGKSAAPVKKKQNFLRRMTDKLQEKGGAKPIK